MVAVPKAMPVTCPNTELTVVAVAIEVLLLLQVPLPAQANMVLPPEQITVLPKMSSGGGLTTMGFTAMQPVPRVYVIVAVPARTLVTRPELLTVAIDVLLLLQVPPAVLLDNDVVRP